MIGAVTTTAGTSTLVRNEVEASSAARSFAANPDRLQIAPPASKSADQGVNLPEVGFVSPTVRVDSTSKVAVLEFRDSLTGDVVAQIPSKEQLKAYRIRQAKENDALDKELRSDRQATQEAKTEGRSEPEKVDAETVTPQDYAKYSSETTV